MQEQDKSSDIEQLTTLRRPQKAINCLKQGGEGLQNQREHQTKYEAHARIQRGGVRTTPPPPMRFVRGGVLCGCLMGRRGVQGLFLSYYYIFLARIARQYCT